MADSEVILKAIRQPWKVSPPEPMDDFGPGHGWEVITIDGTRICECLDAVTANRIVFDHSRAQDAVAARAPLKGMLLDEFGRGEGWYWHVGNDGTRELRSIQVQARFYQNGGIGMVLVPPDAGPEFEHCPVLYASREAAERHEHNKLQRQIDAKQEELAQLQAELGKLSGS